MFVTGWGAFDTHAYHLSTGEVNTRSSAGQPYETTDLQTICNMVADPPKVDKADGQWIIPSSYHEHDARSHRAQAEHGEYGALVVDVDNGDPSLADVDACLTMALGDVWYAIWSTPSAREDYRKWRVLIPLANRLTGKEYSAYQAALFDALGHQGVICDRSLERPGQVLYLPNRGEFYQWQADGAALLNTEGHPMAERATQYLAMAQEQGTAATVAANEGSRSFLRAFRAKHSIDDLLQLYGFECSPTNPDLWRHPGQSTKGYGSIRIMRYADSDRWVSMSETVNITGVGKQTGHGTRAGDAFDLFIHYNCGGNRALAEVYAKQCLAEEDEAKYGDATVEHGAEIVHGLWCFGAAIGAGAKEEAAKIRQEEVAVEHELAQAAIDAEQQKWGGEWLKEVPFPLSPNKLEWLAWNAPGGIGEAVRAKAPQTSRHSLIPLMLGATTLFTHLGQGKFVSRVRQHVTPCALMVFQVGASSSGKSDGTGIFYDLLNEIRQDWLGIAANRVKSFASGQSLTHYLMHESPHVTMLQNEGGADRKAGKGDKHFESLMAGVTDAYTSFEHGIEATYTKSDDKESKAVAHPTVSALQSSTPKKLFASIDAADGESGWLGRFLFIPLQVTLTNENAAVAITFPERLVHRMRAITQVLPPLPNQPDHPDIWTGSTQAFHVIHFTDEAKAMHLEVTRSYDKLATDLRRGEVERAVYGRAAEAVGRLATVAGLAKDHKVDAECLRWADMVVQCSIDYITAQLYNTVEEDEHHTPSSRVRSAIIKLFRKCETDGTAFTNKMGPAGYREGPDGEPQLGLAKLKRRLKDNLKIKTSDIAAEILDMMEDGELVEVTGVDLQTKTKWIKYIG